jgi:hypothetical protein
VAGLVNWLGRTVIWLALLTFRRDHWNSFSVFAYENVSAVWMSQNFWRMPMLNWSVRGGGALLSTRKISPRP